MIPKIIHYIWFSDPPEYPEDIVQCLNSWKEKMPDYEIKLWNAKNFDFSVCPYAEEAYRERKFAFASDYVRLWALYHYGGIYLDSDIEALRSFDDLLNNKAFTGFEDRDRVAAWIFGSEKGNPIFKEFMDDYDGRHFILGEGQYDTTPNPVPITKRLVEHGLQLNGEFQELDEITIYPMDYFCPFNPYRTSGDCFTENTYCNHQFNGAWKKVSNDNERKYSEKEARYIKLLGKKWGHRICKHFTILRHIGPVEWYKKYLLTSKRKV